METLEMEQTSISETLILPFTLVIIPYSSTMATIFSEECLGASTLSSKTRQAVSQETTQCSAVTCGNTSMTMTLTTTAFIRLSSLRDNSPIDKSTDLSTRIKLGTRL